MNKIASKAVAQPRFRTALLGAFAVIGLILTMIGIYGVISYSVTQRTHEIGLRVALGAQREDILRIVLSQGMALAGVGLAIGIGGA
ncbi:MAG TPA: FtsX-like permease family protein, partial [Candidatus Acidoferrales bacterium]|nr:FtsX-like permease family protein [Candidatus Acidoferrales bacterium]